MHTRNTPELEIFAKRVLRKFCYWNHGNVKKVSILGQKNCLTKKRIVTFLCVFAGYVAMEMVRVLITGLVSNQY